MGAGEVGLVQPQLDQAWVVAGVDGEHGAAHAPVGVGQCPAADGRWGVAWTI
jgi:hypothetical protein